MKDWAEIRALHRRDGLSKREIARRLGISRVTVDRAVASDRPPQYSWPAVATSFTPVEPLVRELLRGTLMALTEIPQFCSVKFPTCV